MKMGRKMAVVALVAVAAMLAMSQPAIAGVGGCYPRPGVGGCWQLNTPQQTPNAPSVLDNLGGAIPYDWIAVAKGLLAGRQDGGTLKQPGTITTQGVGGCIPKPGVGGCFL
jgi:hypothetical protein